MCVRFSEPLQQQNVAASMRTGTIIRAR
jgi:hypothetical protein